MNNSRMLGTEPFIVELVNLPYEDLLSLCKTDKYLDNLCNTDYLWNLRAENEFIGYNINVDSKPEDYSRIFGLKQCFTVKQCYKQLYNISTPVNIFVDKVFIKTIRIFHNKQSIIEQLTPYKLLFYTDKHDNVLNFKTPEGEYQFNDKNRYFMGAKLKPDDLTGITNAYIFTDSFIDIDEEIETTNVFLSIRDAYPEIFERNVTLEFPNGSILNRQEFASIEYTVKHALHDLIL
jgi:hypothetical protein